MMLALIIGVLVVAIATLLVGVLVLKDGRLAGLERAQETAHRTIRDEADKARAESSANDRALREELGAMQRGSTQSLVSTLGELSNAQRNQLEAFSGELARLNERGQSNAKELREELQGSVATLGNAVVGQVGQLAIAQKSQLETFAASLRTAAANSEQRLESMRKTTEASIKALQVDSGEKLEVMRKETAASVLQARVESATTLKGFGDSLTKSVGQLGKLQSDRLEGFQAALTRLVDSNERKQNELKTAVEAQLVRLRDDNAKKLDEMRQTVDEKLQGTLEKRLGESFLQVSKQLEQVHNGLGEMQILATGVGDLKKVLTNVKTRGTWGEVALGSLLDQVLAAEQYQQNVQPNPNSSGRVEFAIKLPGADTEGPANLWLPIDAKFPQEDYVRLVEAQDAGDAEGIADALKKMDARLKACGKDIHDKYICPPYTTGFAVMYLPTEGLYAEAVRRPALTELLQRDYRVVIAGPTTLAALLNSLQMGFRTLAIQKRSSEVWTLLAAIKTEFGKFGGLLDKVEKKLQEATNVVAKASSKSRTIERKLRSVQELPEGDTCRLLGAADGMNDEVPVIDVPTGSGEVL